MGKADVEAWLDEMGSEYAWGDDDSLTYSFVVTPKRTHPKTGEDLFYAQPHCFHHSYYQAHPGFQLTAKEHEFFQFGLPTDIAYGNGDILPVSIAQYVRSIFYKHTVALSLQKGDVLVLDNLLAGHSRFGWDPSNTERIMRVRI